MSEHDRTSSSVQLAEKEFHIAPMLDVSTIEFRYFMRLLTKRAVLWTEMVVAETLVHNSQHNTIDDTDIQLDLDLIRHCGWFDERDYETSSDIHELVNPHPITCQIGTNNPSQASFATRVVQACGYDRIDLNAECPSDRVAGREFGAALMKDQDTAVDVIKSMVAASQSFPGFLPVSIKTRIGVDEFDTFDHLVGFVERLVDAGCRRFVIHARKVYTQGLSPAKNRTIPPLNYSFVYRLIEFFPQCDFWLNGGIVNLRHAKNIAYGQSADFDQNECSFMCPDMPHGSCILPPKQEYSNLRGVMVGRLARDNPAELADIDRYFYGATNPSYSRREVMERYIQFIERIYPRRCCDDNEMITCRMVTDMEQQITHHTPYCSICEEFPPQSFINIRVHKQKEDIDTNHVTIPIHAGKRRKRQNHGKVKSGILDRAIQPVLGILYGQRGNNLFRRELHQLSRNMAVRNCGPAYILRKAMAAINQEVWDTPFSLNGTAASYIPTR